MQEQSLTIETFDARKLCAVVNIPNGTPRANIVMSHGLSGNKDGRTLMQKELCEHLCMQGYKVLRFDYRGHGNSGTDSENFCISGAQTDISAAINQVFGKEKISIIGFSVGGATAVIYTYINPERVRSLVLWGPVLSFLDGFVATEKSTWGRDFIKAGGLDTVDKDGVISIESKGGFKIGKKFFDEMKIVRHPYELISDLTCPILVIHSYEDEAVKYCYSEKYGTPNKLSKLLTVTGPHNLEPMRQEVITATTQWFNSHL